MAKHITSISAGGGLIWGCAVMELFGHGVTGHLGNWEELMLCLSLIPNFSLPGGIFTSDMTPGQLPFLVGVTKIAASVSPD